jgi:hypothetical protein
MAGLLALGLAAPAAADRLETFRELAARYVEVSDPEADGLLSQMFELIDAEVIDSLRSGTPFASAPFIQDQLDGFSAAWGGAAFRVAQPGRDAKHPLTIVLATVTRGEPRGSLRIYGPARGGPARLAAAARDGVPELHAWPSGRDGATQFVTSWLGVPTGRGSRPLYLELWRRDGREGVARLWSSDEAFPEGAAVRGFAIKEGQLAIRYEVHYPGWKPGCDVETEQEDVYRQPPGGEKLALQRRRVWNGWHRELHAVVTRFFGALGTGDGKLLAELVPDPSVRARLPRTLRAEAACDQLDAGPAGTIIVAATGLREHRLAPWSLAWRHGPRGWRLAAATPVLQ